MSEAIDRSKFIGSSEISSVLGINPYQTPLQLWAIKTKRVEAPDLSDNESVEWGKRLERVVSAKFAEKNNVKLIAYKRRFVHERYPFLSCELDNIIAGTDEIVEIKTANANMFKDWKDADQIPSHYICQVMFALGLSKRKVGHIAVLIGGQKYLEKRIDFDQEFFDDMVNKAVIFWGMVQDNVPPTAMLGDDDVLLALHPKDDEQIQDLQEMNDSIRLLQETKGQIKALKEQQEAIEVKLKEVIGDNLGVKTSEYLVTWKPIRSTYIDKGKMEQDGILQNYQYKTESRRMMVKLNKGGSNG